MDAQTPMDRYVLLPANVAWHREVEAGRYSMALLEGKIRSCIGITEPDAVSSDPTNLQTMIKRDGMGLTRALEMWPRA